MRLPAAHQHDRDQAGVFFTKAKKGTAGAAGRDGACSADLGTGAVLPCSSIHVALGEAAHVCCVAQ